jgi:predicted thioredoxin/glutaredoxin
VGVVLVTRKGCHLCDEALELLLELGHEPELLDVDADDSAYALYDWRVPVVLVDNRVVAEGRVNAEALRKALRGPGKGSEKSP